MQLKKFLRRTIRNNGVVERLQQKIRLNPRLYLAPIGLTVDIRAGDVLIDCGANVGDVTSSFARTGAPVYAFEPDPLCFSVLQKRFSLTPNVTCFHKGVMDRNCSLVLNSPNAHEKWDDLESTVASSFVHESSSGARQTQVDCVDLSQFVISLKMPVRVLKIDIEGAEIAVVNRLIDTRAMDMIDLAIVETHETQQPSLLEATTALRKRIIASGYEPKFRLDWI
jgi:FkbM family methyltransferase